MSIRSGQAIVVTFTTRSFSTGVAVNADSLPTGTLYVNGLSNAAVVTVANLVAGDYTSSFTLPTLAVGDVVDLKITATVSTVTDSEIVWRDSKDFFAGSIPDVAAGGSGGLFIAGTNAATTVTTSFTTTFTGNLTGSVASVTAIDTTGGKVSGVVLVDTLTTYTGDTPQTGDAYAMGKVMWDLNEDGVVNAADKTIWLARLAHLDADVSQAAEPGDAMTLDPTQAIPTTNAANTLGDCLNAARAQGFGKWVISGTTLTLYAPDGTTVVRTFTLNSATAPTQRV